MMNRSERDRAQRISEYVDGLVVHRREEQIRPFSADDDEFRELASLAARLSRINLRAPDRFQDDLRDWLGAAADASGSGATPAAGWLSRVRLVPWPAGVDLRARIPVLRAAAAMGVLVAALVMLLPQVASPPTASAAEILSRADAALGRLVRPGQVLYRRWKVVERTTSADGVVNRRETVSHEWMDGSDFGRVAGRNERDGRVYLAYASTRENGELKPRVYFAPGFSNESRGLLSIEPSRREFLSAVTTFVEADRVKLQTYLSRGYIFEPISGERRFNQLAIETDQERDEPLPRIMLSLKEETLPTGVAVHAVRIYDPARVRFRWKSSGPPVAWLEQRETVRYIARDTHLSLGSEERFDTEDGRAVFTTRELLETRVVESGAMTDDPFVMTVPDDTPVRQQSAGEQLAAVARVLRVLPARLTTSALTLPGPGVPAQ